MILLVDGDVLVYIYGFMAQKNVYIASVDNKVIYRGYSKDKALSVKGATIAAELDLMEFGLVTQLLDDKINTLIETVRPKDQEVSHQVFLTSTKRTDNFRHTIEGNLPYKGQRKLASKPIYYEMLRLYLQTAWNAQTIVGQEADDEMCIQQTQLNDETVIASIDKDLRQCPGYHINIETLGQEFIADPGYYEPQEGGKFKGGGFHFFCIQMLVGDTADNIAGIYGVGPSKAYKLLSRALTIKEMWTIIEKQYKTGFHDKLKTLPANIAATAELLWMRRNYNQTFKDWWSIHSEDTVNIYKQVS